MNIKIVIDHKSIAIFCFKLCYNSSSDYNSQKIHNFFSKMYWQVLKKDIIYNKISKQTKRVLKEVRKC